MSVELAMQREMAYRQKLENLRAERGGGSTSCSTTSSRKDPLPSQVPMPTSTQAPRTTPGHTTNSGPCPTPGFLPNPRPLPYFGPRPGQAPLLRPYTWYRGPVPSPMLLARPPFPGPRSRPSPPSGPNHPTSQKRKQTLDYYCDLCQVDCNNPFNLKMHLKGKKHQDKLKEPKGMKITGGGTEANERLHCELCGIRCSNKLIFREHLNCKNHIFRLHASESKGNGPDGDTAMPRI